MIDEPRPVHHIAVALIRREDELLLVRQQDPASPASFWAPPGGRAEEGEMLTEALAREVREETGLRVREVGQLAFVAQTDNQAPVQLHEHRGPGPGYLSTAFVFEIAEWDGELRPADPDGYVKEARFDPVADAVAELEKISYRAGSEPGAAYLRGEAGPGAVWLYRRSRDGTDSLVGRAPAGVLENLPSTTAP